MKGPEVSEPLPGIWRVREHGIASYIVKLSPGAIVIDVGPAPKPSGVMMGLQTARVGLSSVRAILLTSYEPEAVGGLQRLGARSGAPARGPALLEGEGASAIDVHVEPLEPGRIIHDHFQTVALGAPGTLGYFFRPARALFAGGESVVRPSALTTTSELALDIATVLGRSD